MTDPTWYETANELVDVTRNLASRIEAAAIREDVQLGALRGIWDIAHGETPTFHHRLPDGVTPMHVAGAVSKLRPRSQLAHEWRQEFVHRFTSDETDDAVRSLRAEWQSNGWQCRRLWGGGHDVILVGCRVRL